MNPEDESRLRLRDSAGVLTGEWVSFPEPGVEHVQKLTYLKVDGDRLTYGFMNGMRPRGMLLFEGRRTGDTLKGRCGLAVCGSYRRPENQVHRRSTSR